MQIEELLCSRTAEARIESKVLGQVVQVKELERVLGKLIPEVKAKVRARARLCVRARARVCLCVRALA